MRLLNQEIIWFCFTVMTIIMSECEIAQLDRQEVFTLSHSLVTKQNDRKLTTTILLNIICQIHQAFDYTCKIVIQELYKNEHLPAHHGVRSPKLDQAELTEPSATKEQVPKAPCSRSSFWQIHSSCYHIEAKYSQIGEQSFSLSTQNSGDSRQGMTWMTAVMRMDRIPLQSL